VDFPRDLRPGISTLLQASDIAQEIQRSVLVPSQVLNEAHDQTVVDGSSTKAYTTQVSQPALVLTRAAWCRYTLGEICRPVRGGFAITHGILGGTRHAR
jgi:hypothetical protein